MKSILKSLDPSIDNGHTSKHAVLIDRGRKKPLSTGLSKETPSEIPVYFAILVPITTWSLLFDAQIKLLSPFLVRVTVGRNYSERLTRCSFPPKRTLVTFKKYDNCWS